MKVFNKEISDTTRYLSGYKITEVPLKCIPFINAALKGRDNKIDAQSNKINEQSKKIKRLEEIIARNNLK